MENTNEWVKVGAGAQGDSWDFETNPEIVGIFLGKEEGVGPNEQILYSIETKDGPFVVWGSALLDKRLKNVVEGEEVKIVYLGKEKSQKTGRTFKNYDVYHRKSSQNVNPDEIPFP